MNVLVLLDRSGSMADSVAGETASRWDFLSESLATALYEAADNPRLSVGLGFFPGGSVGEPCSGDGCCQADPAGLRVEIAQLATNVDSIVGMLQETLPSGMTPALEAALAYFTVEAGSELQGDKYVVLATDGGPNCNSELICTLEECTLNIEQNCSTWEAVNCCAEEGTRFWCADHARTMAQITALAGAGIRTVVIGLVGSEPYAEWMAQFAVAGQATNPAGTSSRPFYAIDPSDSVAAWTDLFRAVTSNIAPSCRFRVLDAPGSVKAAQTNVALDCTVIARASGNWTLDTSSTPPVIELAEAYCEQVHQETVRLDLVLGCPTQI